MSVVKATTEHIDGILSAQMRSYAHVAGDIPTALLETPKDLCCRIESQEWRTYVNVDESGRVIAGISFMLSPQVQVAYACRWFGIEGKGFTVLKESREQLKKEGIAKLYLRTFPGKNEKVYRFQGCRSMTEVEMEEFDKLFKSRIPRGENRVYLAYDIK